MHRILAPRPAARAAAVLLLTVWTGLAAGCSRPRPPERPAAPTPAPVPSPAPTPAEAVLGRDDLIAAAAAARDAYAGGAPYPMQNAQLIGRRFSLRLPFGCGPAPDPADVARIEADPAKGSLTLAAQPQVWTGAAWLAPILGPGAPVEAVEGFWIRRPWLTSDACPATPAPFAAAPTTPAGAPPAVAPPPVANETLGLVRVYRAGESRLRRHARHPYRAVLKLSDPRLPLDRRFWLILEGRVVSLDGDPGKGQPIRCAAQSVDSRPVCLVGVDLDHVAVAAQATGAILAEWPG